MPWSGRRLAAFDNCADIELLHWNASGLSSAKLASSLRKSEPPGSQKAAGSTKLSLCIPRVLCSAEAQPFCRASTLGCAGTASYVHRTNRMFSFLPSPITTRFKRQGRRQDAQERAVLLSSCLTSLFFAGFSNLLLTRGWYMIKIKPSDGAPPVRTRLNAVILHCACNEKRERHGVARSRDATRPQAHVFSVAISWHCP